MIHLSKEDAQQMQDQIASVLRYHQGSSSNNGRLLRLMGATLQAAIDAPEPERNYCQRCGKRSGCDAEHIHTCTPPAPQARELSDDEAGYAAFQEDYFLRWGERENPPTISWGMTVRKSKWIAIARAVLAARGAP